MDKVCVDSLFVAEAFGKHHRDILGDIRRLLDPRSGLSKDFRMRNFKSSMYRDSQNKKQPCFELTLDGLTMLIMTFTGRDTLERKEFYIKYLNDLTAAHLFQLKEL